MHAAALQSNLASTAFWCAESFIMHIYCYVIMSKLRFLLMFLLQDIARATFCRLTEDIHALKARYQEQHRLNDLKVHIPIPWHLHFHIRTHPCHHYSNTRQPRRKAVWAPDLAMQAADAVQCTPRVLPGDSAVRRPAAFRKQPVKRRNCRGPPSRLPEARHRPRAQQRHLVHHARAHSAQWAAAQCRRRLPSADRAGGSHASISCVACCHLHAISKYIQITGA